MTSSYPLTLRALVRTLAGRPACSSPSPAGTPAPVLRGAASASILEVMLYVILVAMLMVAYMPLEKKSTDTLRWNTTADQLTTVSDASKRYIQDNEETLLQTVTAGHPQTVSAKTLQDSGYIPAGFGLTNLSDQDWTLAVALNPKQSGKLEAFVLSANGNAISFDGMRTVSASAGGMAGYIRSSNVATGAYGGWEVNLSDYGLSATPGHLAMYLTSDVLGTSNEASDRLYRYTVSNRPDLNTMHTAIDMGANNLNNAGTVNTKAVTASGAIQSDTLTASTSVTTNALTANNSINTNSLYANGITASGNIVASGTVNGNAVTSNGDMTANGTVTGNAVRANGRLSGGEVLQLDQVNTAGAACSPNGLVSHDVNGAILSCQSGVWAGGSGGYPTGSPIPWPTATPPPGYLLCNGQSFNTAAYPKLASVYPSGVLPDLRGVFIRGLDSGRGFDSGRTILSYQADTSGMVYNDGGHLEGHHSGMNYYSPGGESRPKNVAFNYIVRAE